MRRTKVLLVAAAAALTLTGCAGLRPGVGAEVGDETITLEEIDAFAEGLCAYNRGNGAPETASVDLRLSSLRALVVARLAHRFGEENDLEVSRSEIDATMAQIADQLKGLPADGREEFLDQARYTLEGDDYTRQAVTAYVEGNGEELTNESAAAAQQAIFEEWAQDADVEVDPRFGEWDEADLKVGSGSLSVTDDASTPSPPDTPTEGLPKSQTCG